MKIFVGVLLFCLLILNIIVGNPIKVDRLEFEIVDCIESENETSTSHILVIKNFNGTCIQINQTEFGKEKISLYVLPNTQDGIQIHIKSQNCSSTLSDVYLSECDESDQSNITIIPVTFDYFNISNDNSSDVDSFDIHQNESVVVTEETLYTGPTIYQTLHHLHDSESEEEDKESITDVSEQITQEFVEIKPDDSDDDEDDQ